MGKRGHEARASSPTDRRWQKPEVRKLAAGSAETGTFVTFTDGASAS